MRKHKKLIPWYKDLIIRNTISDLFEKRYSTGIFSRWKRKIYITGVVDYINELKRRNGK